MPLFCYDFARILHGLYYQMSYAETSGFGLSWLLAIVPFNIGPKYEFASNLVQNSPKQEPHSRSNTI